MQFLQTIRTGAATVLAVFVMTAVAVTMPSHAGAGTVAADPDVVREILFPVVGPVHFGDTFGACRSGCSRHHEGTDLMAARLTPLVAVRDATVRRIAEHATPDGSRGNYIFLRDAEGWEYWYIHTNNDTPGTDDGANPAEWRFAPGVVEGAEVRAGQLISWVGDSGNAEWTAPHLHFEIHTPAGEVVNPYRSLVYAPRIPVAVGTVPPSAPAFVDALAQDFIGRPPGDIERALHLAALTSPDGRPGVIGRFAGSDEWMANLVDGYYRSALGRGSDPTGLAYWVDVIRSGTPPAAVAANFYASDEYFRTSGGTPEAWLRALYEEVLGRPADPAGLDYWVERSATMPRDQIALPFYQSEENRQVRVDALYRALLGRSADVEGRRYWAGLLADGHDVRLATHLAASDEYLVRAVRRFG